MKTHLLWTALAVVLTLPACAAREWTEAVAPAQGTQELQALHRTVETLKTENQHIRAEGEKAMAAAGKDNERLRNRIAYLEAQVLELEGQAELARAAENKSQKLEKLVAALETELRKLPARGLPQTPYRENPLARAQPGPAAVEPPAKGAALLIKVLSGDGDPASAEAMSRRLTAMGYAARPAGLAERENFERHTVYFSPAFEAQAGRIANELGPQSRLKPLTWPSRYGVIVVTGQTNRP